MCVQPCIIVNHLCVWLEASCNVKPAPKWSVPAWRVLLETGIAINDHQPSRENKKDQMLDAERKYKA